MPAYDDSSDGSSSDGGASDSTSSDSSISDAGASDYPSSDGTSSDGGTDASSSDAGSSDAGSSDGGSSDGGTSSSSSSSSAPVDYKAMVAIPSGSNNGLTSASPATMTNALGNPGNPDPNCGTSSAALQKLMKTANVGPFRVTGLGPAVDALTRVFSAVQSAKPDLYALLGTAGMLCVRYVRGSTTNFSNHSWGTAIDITIGGVLTPRGSATVQQGLVDLCPFMNAEQFFWGAGFSPTPDGMHYEASSELIAQWKSDGTIP
jgi:hypothetical protein